MKILYFDIAAVFILAILLMSLFFRKMLSGRANKYLAFLLVDIIISAILDCWAEAYNVWLPAKESNTLLREIQYYCYFLFRNVTLLLYQLFVCAVTDTWHILVRNKWLKWLFAAPYILICCTLLSNPFNHQVFYFDENLIYTRGPLIYILYGASFTYFIFGVVYLLKYKRMLTTDKFIALILMYPLNLLAVLIQLFYPELMVELFVNSLTMLLVTTVVQRPEEMVNPILGVRSYVAYTSDMRKAFYIRKPVRFIFVKLVNYHALFTLLGNDTYNTLMKSVSLGLQTVHSKEHLPMDLYYLENGLFALVSEKDEPEKLKCIAQRISSELGKAVQLEQLELGLDACICILRCPQDIDNYERLMSFGNLFHKYLPSEGVVNEFSKADDRRVLQLRNDIDSIICNAIAENRFEMYYQPIYSIKEKKFLSAEALIRLYDENYGFISPELFIPAAERNGTILQIGEFVLNDVCRFLAKCEKNGLGIEYLELNLSMVQCMQRNLTDKVLFYMRKYGLRPEQINLEITETAANTAQDIVEDNIQALWEQGIHFSLDDYGTGYSNISRIMALPFRIVKLDKSLADKVKDSRTKIVLKNTIRMLKEIGMEIVVEGVETLEALQQFTQLECDFIQGFYFSKPLPEQKFVKFIQENNMPS